MGCAMRRAPRAGTGAAVGRRVPWAGRFPQRTRTGLPFPDLAAATVRPGGTRTRASRYSVAAGRLPWCAGGHGRMGRGALGCSPRSPARSRHGTGRAPCDRPVVAAGRRTGTCRRARCPAGWARAGPRPRPPSLQSVPRRTPTAASRRWRAVPPCGARWSGRGAGICGPRSRRVRPPSGRGPPPRFPERHVGRHPRFGRSASWQPRARPRRGGGGAPAAPPVRAGNRTQQQAGQAQPPWRAARPDGPKWIPHSVLARPRHRPPRGSSPGAQGEVQGAQPMEG